MATQLIYLFALVLPFATNRPCSFHVKAIAPQVAPGGTRPGLSRARHRLRTLVVDGS
jgi:hypothetical protein